VADHARESDTAEVVRRALDRLPQRMRTAVMLRYFEGMTEPEFAAALGISLGTVKSTVSRAVAKLRVDPELGEDSGACVRVTRQRGDLSAGIQGLLPGARLVALSGMQVRHPEEVARCGAR
jgi:DNA-binding NarL/FixJ family response regulator